MRDIIHTATTAPEAVDIRNVCIYMNERSIVLHGNWQWDLYSNAVFCSDVILSFPQEFNGTKGIIHPGDVEMLRHKLELLKLGETADVQFSIITTYGEIKVLTGEQISLSEDDQRSFNEPEQQVEEQLSRTEKWKLENEKLHADKNAADLAERITHTGSWHYNTATNKTFYSDNIYRIYGLPPQSLNAHLNSFTAFIHSDDKASFMEAFDAAFSKRLPLQLQFRIISSDRQEKHIEYIMQWSFNQKGERVLNGIIRDNTQQQLLEQKVQNAETETEFHKKLLQFNEQTANMGSWQVNLLTRKTFYSDNYFKLFGLKPNSSIPAGNIFLNLIHPDDRQLVEEANRKLIYEHTVPDIEFRVLRENGKMRHLKQRGRLMVYGDSELVMACTVYDITSQKLLQEKIEELRHEQKLHSYAGAEIENYTGSCYWLWNLENGEITWSDNFYHFLGYKPNTLVLSQKLLLNFVHPDDRLEFTKNVKKCLEEETYFNFRLLRRSEIKQISALLRITEIEGSKYCIGIFKDETQQHTLQQQLKSKLQFLDIVIDAIHDRLLVTDINYQIIEWNKRCEESFGMDKDAVLHQNLFDVFPQLKKEEVFESFRKVFSGEIVKQDYVTVFNNKEKLNIYLAPLYDHNGDTVGIIHVLHDITKEFNLQKDLSERLAFIEKLVESSVDRIIVLDNNMNYLYWNRRCEEHYRLNKEALIGKNILDIYPGSSRPMYPEFRKALKGETIYIPPRETEMDGYHETYLEPLKNTDGEVSGVLWVMHDLTERREAEKKAEESMDILLQTAEATPDCITIYDLTTKHPVYINNRLAEWIGLDANSLVHMGIEGILALIHPDDRQAIIDLHSDLATAKNNVLHTLEYRILTKRKEYLWIRNRSKVFRRDESGNVTHTLSVIQEITEQKKNERIIVEKNHYLQRMLATVPDMISIIELKTMRIDYLNEEMFKAHHFDPDKFDAEEWQCKGWFIHEQDRKALADYFEQLSNASDDETAVFEYRARDDNGVWKWFLARGRVFQRNEEGKPTHVLNVIENITSRKNNELEILRLQQAIVSKKE